MAVIPTSSDSSPGGRPPGESLTGSHSPSPAHTEASDRFQILALDGGGAKALFTAHVLARLEEDLGVRIQDCFDLVAGTSAGGIVALALGAGLRPAEIVEHYQQLIATVFPASRRTWRSRLAQLNSPIYDADVLRTALQDVLGAELLGQSTMRLVIPSWDVQARGVHIFKTPHHARLRRDWRIPMVDVALATSAAPLYFPAAAVDGHRLIDGGVWANNPSVVAIAEALSMLDVPLSAIRVLNIGTIDQLSYHPRRRDRGGLLQWMKPIAPLILDAGSRGGQGLAEHLVGKDNFIRFDALVPGGLYSLDAADPADVAGLAAAVSRNLSPLFTERFGGHSAEPYLPLYGPDADSASSPTEASDATR
ncbi:patatin-like phospholipase family protein [Microbacterium jejuense]|uniref:Patatin-like phospholipase family protein n=1 Tax=Microbacterium jejuense TaxID=1263637 RepID=A0ABS7HLX1_9MICO|nr:CBASS cGAMP-activated phospholipase [Microbacterium jejuense]MBW9093054.1 patatin-like phospholipase family protein [Microbacterium jejuense]